MVLHHLIIPIPGKHRNLDPKNVVVNLDPYKATVRQNPHSGITFFC